MMLDTIKLSGLDAYLKADSDDSDPTNRINLSRDTTRLTGVCLTVGKGQLMEISGIFIQIEGTDLVPLFQRQQEPLISIEVKKEMFPGLFSDPYQHRVHTIAGFDDFNRGVLENLKVMDVDGYPTLVSFGSLPCKWTSAIYQFPHPFTVDAAAWYLPTSKQTPPDGFKYSIKLNFWKADEKLDQAAQHSILLAGIDTKPTADRFIDDLDICLDSADVLPVDIIAYQIEFNATVNYDTYLKEYLVGLENKESMGRPLLRSVNLLEKVTPAYEFYSLNELINSSAAHQFFEERQGKLKKINATIYITAALEKDEAISLMVHNDTLPRTKKLAYVDARLDGEIRLKPPVIEK
ncbi:Uncharacterised protein [uncultured archaeon]|nr:Uncharacterised protein [uncultured archaeon]